jgi:hypothetical protein
MWALAGRGGNTVVIGASRRHDVDRVAGAAAADPSPARLLTHRALSQLIARTTPLRDEDLEPELTAPAWQVGNSFS